MKMICLQTSLMFSAPAVCFLAFIPGVLMWNHPLSSSASFMLAPPFKADGLCR